MAIFNQDIFNNNNNYSSQSLIPEKSKEELKKEAEHKYSKISSDAKGKYLAKRKRNIKALYISLGIFSILYFFIGLMTELDETTASSGGKFLLVILGGLAIYSFCSLFIKLKKSNEELIIEQIVKELRKNYKNLTREKISQWIGYVKNKSPMYKEIKTLNSQYSFERYICNTHSKKEFLNSKRQLDNFNYEKWIYEYINDDFNFFIKMQPTYEENKNKYIEYSQKYKKLEKYLDVVDTENFDVDFETFNYIEKKLFKQSKHEEIIAPNINLKISYTSPSGRNHYEQSHNYSYLEILNYMKQKIQIEREKELELERKEKAAIEKRAKEKRLRELNKLEVKLAQKEQEINKKEKEFLEATKEHIYTADKIETKKQEIEIDENLSLTQKLKLLKEKFDNGEITYEEYQTKRKELM